MKEFSVPTPDQADIFIHNHNLLNRSSWLFIVLGLWMATNERYYAMVCAGALFIFARSMSRLLCGWVHAWAALHMRSDC